ncbi:MAG: DUF928 domain-containing protein [Mucilaginibacter sp.]
MRNFITIILIWLTVPALGQITLQFVPEVYGRNTIGLFNCKIVNPFQQQSVTLTITVSERKAGTVCIVRTPAFTLAPGASTIPLSAVRAASTQFSSTKLGQLLAINRTFPEGDYDYCYSLSFVHSDNMPEEQCFSYTLTPFAELNLIDPYDQDKLCYKRPLLTWSPLIPAVSGSFYQVVISEIKPGQNATEALNYNIPVINQSNIMAPVLPYPGVAPDLVPKKKYAWQVTAYKDNTVLNRSEIWTFTIDCQDTVKKIVDDGYRDIEDLLNGNYYVAQGMLKFAVINPYQSQDLRYEIQSIEHPDKTIKGLPRLKLNTGSNMIRIDFANRNALTDGSYYILKVWLPNGTVRSLRFIYQYVK